MFDHPFEVLLGVAQFILELLLRRDVLTDPDSADRVAIPIAQARQREQDVPNLPVFGQKTGLVVLHIVGVLQPADGDIPLPRIREQALDPLANQLDTAVTQRLFRTAVEGLNKAIGSDGDDDVGRVLNDPPHVLHGAAQLVSMGFDPSRHGVERFLQDPDFVVAFLVEPEVKLVGGNTLRSLNEPVDWPLQQPREHDPQSDHAQQQRRKNRGNDEEPTFRGQSVHTL